MKLNTWVAIVGSGALLILSLAPWTEVGVCLAIYGFTVGFFSLLVLGIKVGVKRHEARIAKAKADGTYSPTAEAIYSVGTALFILWLLK